MTLVPLAVYYFCSNFFSRRDSFYAAVTAIFLPSVYVTNYTWGQLPSLFALNTALFSGYFLWRYLEKGRPRQVLLAALLVGLTAASHHLTFICFIPIIVAVTVLLFWSHTRTAVKPIVKRLLVFCVFCLPLVVIPIFPFWKFAFTSVIQTTIPHITRTNLFANWNAFLEFVLSYYFLFLLAIPFTILVILKDRKLVPLWIAAVFLFILGLGGTTPVPHLIFGPWWNWLTYERFALWSSILFVPLVVKLLPIDLISFGPNRSRFMVSALLIAAFVAMGVGSAFLGTEPVRRTFLPSPPVVNVTSLVTFLDGPEVGQQYRYITLGFGEPQMEKLSALSTAQSLDGTYYTARTLPVLTQSGIASLDSSRFFDPGLTTLNIVLSNAPSYNLKWVLVNDVYYYQTLEAHGFSLEYSAASLNDYQLAGVTIWEKDGIPPISASPKVEEGFWSYMWGNAPLTLLLSFVILLTFEVKSSRHKRAYSGE